MNQLSFYNYIHLKELLLLVYTHKNNYIYDK